MKLLKFLVICTIVFCTQAVAQNLRNAITLKANSSNNLATAILSSDPISITEQNGKISYKYNARLSDNNSIITPVTITSIRNLKDIEGQSFTLSINSNYKDANDNFTITFGNNTSTGANAAANSYCGECTTKMGHKGRGKKGSCNFCTR